jgi:hypothetical protein
MYFLATIPNSTASDVGVNAAPNISHPIIAANISLNPINKPH